MLEKAAPKSKTRIIALKLKNEQMKIESHGANDKKQLDNICIPLVCFTNLVSEGCVFL